jgi:DNA-binding transcriptional ArsR family regulator
MCIMSRAAAADVFHAIADANRRALLDAMASGERPVGDLVEVTGLSYSAVSQHLAILHDAGLVERRKEGKQRLYRLDAAPLREVHKWTSRYEEFWRGRLRRLKQVLGEKR